MYGKRHSAHHHATKNTQSCHMDGLEPSQFSSVFIINYQEANYQEFQLHRSPLMTLLESGTKQMMHFEHNYDTGNHELLDVKLTLAKW